MKVISAAAYLVNRANGGSKPASGRAAASAPDSAAGSGEKVSFSDQARLAAKSLAVAQTSPEVRADKVAALKAQVAAGTYQVDASQVAAKLVDEHWSELV